MAALPPRAPSAVRSGRAQGRSGVLTGTIGARRAWTGFDDFNVVDALEIDRGDAEIAVAELALNDDQRHAFMGHLDRVGVTQSMGREPSAHAGGRRRAPQLGALGGG